MIRVAPLLALLMSAVPAPETVTPGQLNRFLFLAVLEGCMEEGVPDDVVRRLLERREGGAGYPLHFVYACPVCGPVYEGFQAFLKRRDFYYGRKGDPYVEKNRLPADLDALLRDPDAKKLREGLEKLVTRLIERRLKLLRFSADEAKVWNRAIDEGRKKGMELKKQLAPDLEKCPSCEGAFGAKASP